MHTCHLRHDDDRYEWADLIQRQATNPDFLSDCGQLLRDFYNQDLREWV